MEKKPKIINNLLNIKLADNEQIYEKKAKMENQLLKLKGKNPKKIPKCKLFR